MSDRATLVAEIRARLSRRGTPRAHMTFIVLTTGLAGFAASMALLYAGVTRMAIRYPLAVAIAYGVFLWLIWFWLQRFRLRATLDVSDEGGRDRANAWDVVEVPMGLDLADAPDTKDPGGFGGGGGFSGGGGGSNWSGGTPAPVSANLAAGPGSAARLSGMPLRPVAASEGSGASATSLDLVDVDEGALILIPVILVSAVAFSFALYVVYIAPVLFAELLLDVALAAGLYRRLQGVDRRHWLSSAVRQTAIPAIIVAVLLTGAGAVMQAVYPDATSIGRVWERVRGGDGSR